MEKYYGFDLGDAESAIALLKRGESLEPEILSVNDTKSFITAYALLKNGQLLIGEGACYSPDAVNRKLRFKSRFLTDTVNVTKDIKSFAAGVLGELYLNGDLIKGEDSCFYIGCPAGWDKVAREEYRLIFEQTGFPPSKVISESRAALVSACQSKHLQVGYDILSRPVLVVDIGSSTTDFAYIMGGKEVELQTGGEVFLGGGIMDEILLEEAVESSRDPKKIRKIFEESEAWKSYCEFAARRLKEKYFADEEYWQRNDCSQTVSIHYTTFPTKLTLRMNPDIAEKLLNKPVERLDGKSFKEVFIESLRRARDAITEKTPELIFMTGGVSKLAAVRDWTREVFPESIVITGSEPEFSVATGLSYCGKIDDDLREFKNEVNRLISSTDVEQIVENNLDNLYHSTIDAMIEPILTNAAIPVVDRWRNGEIDKLSEIDKILEEEIENYLHTDEARNLMMKPVAAWLKKVSYALEEYTIPICTKYNVPYSALSLNSYMSLSDFEIKLEAKNLFAVDEITWLIDTVITLIVSFLCGGSGIAMISSGPTGIVAGALISLRVLALGKDKMQDAMVNISIPSMLRKLVSRSYFESRLTRLAQEIKANLFKSIDEDKNLEMTERLVSEISGQIEHCLIKMAEVVEIPLG